MKESEGEQEQCKKWNKQNAGTCKERFFVRSSKGSLILLFMLLALNTEITVLILQIYVRSSLELQIN